MQLDVGVGDVPSAADEAARLEVIGCPQAALEHQPCEADAGFGPHPHDAVEGDRLPAGHLHIDFEMILQVGADPRKGMPDFDAERPELLRKADAGELKQLWRVDCTARKRDEAACPHRSAPFSDTIRHTDRSASVEQKTFNERVLPHLEVLAATRGVQVGAHRGPALTMMDRHVKLADALLAVTIEILGSHVSRLLTGFNKDLVEGIEKAAGAGSKRTPVPAQFPHVAGKCLRALEVRQHVSPAPSLRTQGLPSVEVQWMTADVNHPIDGGGATQDLAARAMKPAIAEMRLRLRVIAPIVARRVHGDGEGARHADEDCIVGTAGFQ